jgi:peptidyl-prolyl cis-trans isomerase D
VIAHLMEIKEKGTLPLELVKHKMEPNLRREKKATILMDKMKGATSADDIASKLNLTADTASKVSFASGGIPGKAYEPEVIGRLFTYKQGETTKPLKGNGGVYVITITEYYDNEPAPANYRGIQAKVMSAYSQKTESAFIEALKDLANIIDNRGKYF